MFSGLFPEVSPRFFGALRKTCRRACAPPDFLNKTHKTYIKKTLKLALKALTKTPKISKNTQENNL